MVLTAGIDDVNFVAETKVTANTTVIRNPIMTEEAPEKPIGLGFGYRVRRKSKYLSYPYLNIEPEEEVLSAEREDSRTHESSAYTKSGSEIKSLSGLSDVNANTSSGVSLRPERKLIQKVRVTEVTSVHQQPNVEINLKGGSSKYSSIPDASQNPSSFSFVSEGRAVHKEREKIEAPEDPQISQISSVHIDAASHNCSALVIASNLESHVSQKGPIGNVITDHSLAASSMSVVGTVPVSKAGLKNTMVGTAAMPGVTPTQRTQSIAMPAETPPSLEFMKKNLEMMSSILENSGNTLSPHMRAKLDAEIKNLLRRVNSRNKKA